MKKVTVIGAGEMGHGIAEVFALGGYEVSIADVQQKYIDSGMERIRTSLSRLVKKGDITEEKMKGIMENMHTFTDISKSVEGADIVIEAVPEIPELKGKVFAQIDGSAPPHAILGSNTSNIRITDIARNVRDPSRVVGMHFFNPAVVMKLVEIVQGESTSSETVESVRKVISDLNKTPVIVRKDTPGFIVNRINAAELLFFGLLQDRHVATPEEVDAFARSQGLPMGPYELIDFVGVDVVKNSLDYYATELSEEYGKCSIYKELVGQNRLGKKTGKGFYDWSAGRPAIDNSKAASSVSLMDILSLEINEAVKLIEDGVASPEEIDTAVRLGMNRPFGPVSVAKSLTNAEVKDTLERLSGQFSTKLFAPAHAISEGKMREAVDGRLAVQVQGETKQAGPGEEKKGTLLIEEFGHVARITINRPKYNMISSDVLTDLDDAISSLWDRKEIRVVVVTGSGPNFSSGAELSTFIAGAPEFMEYARKGERTLRRLSEMPKVTIAALKGYVLGGALELSLACDIRVSSEDAKLAFPEVTRGLIPAWGGTQMLTRMIGQSRALNMIVTAERITAAQALEYGIVTHIFRDVDTESLEFAKSVATTAAPLATVLAKRLVNRAAEGASDIGLEMESIAAGMLFSTEDLREGIGAFLQKRKAEFKGK